MSKRILVIGSGSALAKATMLPLLKRGYQVVTAGRTHGDVRIDLAQLFKIPAGIAAVVNFAAAFENGTDEAWLEAEQTNALGALHVCMAARKAGVPHVVHISSLSATLPKGSPYYTAYAVTKRNGDDLAELYCKSHDMALAILRPSQIYGNDKRFAAHQPFFYHMLERAERGEDITIYGQHDALRNYINADDLGEIITRVVGQKVTGTYPCVYPTNVRYSEIAQVAQLVFGKGGNVTFLKDKPDIPDNIFPLDLSLYEKIGYRPETTLQQGIRGMQLQGEG